MKRLILWSSILAASAAFAIDPGGIRPRPSPSDYPAQDQKDGVAIGASVLPPGQVKNSFSTDLTRYVVVEVSVYPQNGKPLDLSAQDFALRIGSDAEIIRPADPRAVAAANQRHAEPKPSRASDITLYPTANVGYESGGYDPVTGRRGGGWVTGTGVGVGVGPQGPQGPPPPGSTDRDRDTMKQELQDKTLPSGQVTAPVAGYLYFPLPDKNRKGAYELDYYGVSGKMRILFPAVEKK